MDVALYCALLLFAFSNIWLFVIKKKKYKSLPIPAFYTFAVVALALRPVDIIGAWAVDNVDIYANINWVWQGAKLCVGMVQDWVTVELAVRIHVSKSFGDITEAGIKRLHSIFKIVFAILIVGFTALIITVIVSARQPGNYGIAFFESLSKYC